MKGEELGIQGELDSIKDQITWLDEEIHDHKMKIEAHEHHKLRLKLNRMKLLEDSDKL